MEVRETEGEAKREREMRTITRPEVMICKLRIPSKSHSESFKLLQV